METNKTDKTILFKGIKILIFALLSLVIGPIFMHFALGDKENALYIPMLIVGYLICAMAVILLFKGINTIMNSLFKKKE
ncbi:MAG: DUF6095 family protein [Flavobacteriaceae bacterium]|tara:strand:- start:3283 stop:3519 length:237 start_codon:yes stop_codon:yes gene_type:complete